MPSCSSCSSCSCSSCSSSCSSSSLSSSYEKDNLYPPKAKMPAGGEGEKLRRQNNQSPYFLTSSSSSSAREESQRNSFESTTDHGSTVYYATTPSSSSEDDGHGEGEVYNWLECSHNTNHKVLNSLSNRLVRYSEEDKQATQSPSSSVQKDKLFQNDTIDQNSPLPTNALDHSLLTRTDEPSPFTADYSTKSRNILFTPPAPRYDAPLSIEAHPNDHAVYFQHNYFSGNINNERMMMKSVVKDTHIVKRKNAVLPIQKPNAVKGDWLTNRFVVNNYVLLNHLGKGSYGEVRLCKEKETNKLYAMKIMNKAILKRKTVRFFDLL